MPSQKKVFDF